MNAQTGPDEALQMPKASSVPAAQVSPQPEQPDPPPAAGLSEAEQPGDEPAAPTSLPLVRFGAIQSRRDFLIQTAVVAIGVLLALGLEQAVEAVHHAQQRAQFEEQMRETIEANSPIIARSLERLDDTRAYLVDMQAAVAARRRGRSTPRAPATDPRERGRIGPRLPDLGPLEAAQANGTFALLSVERIQAYNGVISTHRVAELSFNDYLHSLRAFRAFRQRFDPYDAIAEGAPPADLTELSSAELAEYQAIIGAALEAIRGYTGDLRRLDDGSHAVLNGARAEAESRGGVENAQGSEEESVLRRESSP